MNKKIPRKTMIFTILVLLLSSYSLTLSLRSHKLAFNLHLSYKDNLQAQNWYYGNISAVDYRLKIFKSSTNQTLDLCPINAPYTTADMSQC